MPYTYRQIKPVYYAYVRHIDGNSMSGSEKRVDIRIPEVEFQLLEDYCKLTGRTKTDVLRDLIRSLKRKLPKSPGLPG
jgi:hypothetical protein